MRCTATADDVSCRDLKPSARWLDPFALLWVWIALGLVGALPEVAVALTLLRSPYLQQGTPTSMLIRCRTDVASESRVSYGASPNDLSNTVTVPLLTTEHEVKISGLVPATEYFYSVGTSSITLAGGDNDHFFVTSPVAGTQTPIRIWVIGDSGLCAQTQQGCNDAAAVRDAYLNFAGTNIADVWLLLGDNAYNSGTDVEYTEGFFDVYPTVMRNTVVWPAPGNHEFGASDSPTQSGPYYESFTMPKMGEAGGVASGTEAYYSFDFGNVHFIAIDSHDTDRSVGGAMYNWLEADLMASVQDWVIAYWHHPPYSKGSHDSDTESQLVEMRERFVPLLEDFGVDLQLTGHSHSYERSMLIDGHYGFSATFDPVLHALDAGDGDPNGDGAYKKATLEPAPHEGAVYSVVGSSSRNDGGLTAHPIMVIGVNLEGSMVIDIKGSQLDARWIDKNGTLVDHFQILKPVPPGQDSNPNPSSVGSQGGGGGCFIATAAFGSPLAPQVQLLREVRDQYLLPHPAGQALVALYYTLSPPLADVIAGSGILRAIVRVGLVPILAWAALVLWSPSLGVGIPLVILGLGTWLARRLARRRHWMGAAHAVSLTGKGTRSRRAAIWRRLATWGCVLFALAAAAVLEAGTRELPQTEHGVEVVGDVRLPQAAWFALIRDEETGRLGLYKDGEAIFQGQEPLPLGKIMAVRDEILVLALPNGRTIEIARGARLPGPRRLI
ncbi:MAG: purple acid phosphatase family protein, partial [Nitrospiraceae bacterium]